MQALGKLHAQVMLAPGGGEQGCRGERSGSQGGRATQQARAGKEDEWQAASAALAAGKEEQARLTGRREKAEAAFKAEVDRLGKT